jgi:murein DD-endopeptidase MepM/ murein hydrolase activator NlpD
MSVLHGVIKAAFASVVVVGLLIILEPVLRRLIFFARLASMPAPSSLPVPVDGVRPEQIADSYGDPRSGGRTHKGVDIFAPRDTPVRSATDGLILRVGINRLGGNIVAVLGPGLYVHYYAHLDHFGAFDDGDIVKQGDILGYVGNTGNAMGMAFHLHYGLYTPSRGAINPWPLFREYRASRSAEPANTRMRQVSFWSR